jgi:hypothetical protein
VLTGTVLHPLRPENKEVPLSGASSGAVITLGIMGCPPDFLLSAMVGANNNFDKITQIKEKAALARNVNKILCIGFSPTMAAKAITSEGMETSAGNYLLTGIRPKYLAAVKFTDLFALSFAFLPKVENVNRGFQQAVLEHKKTTYKPEIVNKNEKVAQVVEQSIRQLVDMDTGKMRTPVKPPVRASGQGLEPGEFQDIVHVLRTQGLYYGADHQVESEIRRAIGQSIAETGGRDPEQVIMDALGFIGSKIEQRRTSNQPKATLTDEQDAARRKKAREKAKKAKERKQIGAPSRETYIRGRIPGEDDDEEDVYF